MSAQGRAPLGADAGGDERRRIDLVEPAVDEHAHAAIEEVAAELVGVPQRAVEPVGAREVDGARRLQRRILAERERRAATAGEGEGEDGGGGRAQ